ncbi:DUF4160 domain-containing protein [Dyadobacter psychrotolerans]|uniref:DUF4160 domain-containing protein n=1 Tax=Dyadobacter psychrotolerans TaxID=2541721 RepID=A0A4R5DUX6_9BACT|nr:DUF4160 domain-containing protein [Dyadobacter psychrotolerans]TDE18312.1 DUF4160 domain-containing protein [Dyadobacter psychrotolerans]
MPKIAIYKYLTFYFFTADWFGSEPPYLHVSNTKRRGKSAKIWMETMEFSDIGDLNQQDLNLVQKLVATNQNRLLKYWESVKAGYAVSPLILNLKDKK